MPENHNGGLVYYADSERIDSRSTPIFVVSRTGDIVRTNEKALKHAGLTKEDFEGKNIADILPERELTDLHRAAVTGAAAWERETGESFREIELTVKKEIHRFQIRPKFIYENNKRIGFDIEIIDITDQAKDALTKMPTRKALDSFGPRVIERAAKERLPLSTFLLDIDHFKILNDTYGHLAGDQALSHFANILLKHTRDRDRNARYGGEEFLKFFWNTPIAQALQAAEDIRKDVEHSRIASTAGDLNITTSIGIFTSDIDEVADPTSYEATVACADLALYAAKHSGRNRTGVFFHTQDEADSIGVFDLDSPGVIHSVDFYSLTYSETGAHPAKEPRKFAISFHSGTLDIFDNSTQNPTHMLTIKADDKDVDDVLRANSIPTAWVHAFIGYSAQMSLSHRLEA